MILTTPQTRKYFLVDANIVAGYYLPQCFATIDGAKKVKLLFEHIRKHPESHMIYVPNFCIAETINVFTKHSFGKWNRRVKKTIDTRVYTRIVKAFETDIHNAKFMYHLELNRYHVLGINLVSPIDNYFKITTGKHSTPASTFDHLVVSMGIQLVKTHGANNVCVLTADKRLAEIIKKCKSGIKRTTLDRMKIGIAEKLCTVKFSPDIFPNVIDFNDLKTVDQKLNDFIKLTPIVYS